MKPLYYAPILTLFLCQQAQAQQTLYVGDSVGAVRAIAPDGTSRRILKSRSTIWGIATDSARNVYINDGTEIFKITPIGDTYGLARDLQLWQPTGFVADRAGNLYESVIGANAILKITPDGTISTFATGFLGPWSLAIDNGGNLYANDEFHTIYKITPDGQKSVFYSSAGNSIWKLAFDSKGYLYSLVRNTGDVERYSPAGDDLGVYISGLNNPVSLIFDQSDNLYVGEFDNRAVVKYDAQGQRTVIFDSSQGLAFPYTLGFSPAVVPESGRATLLTGIAFGVGLLRKRRRRTAAFSG